MVSEKKKKKKRHRGQDEIKKKKNKPRSHILGDRGRERKSVAVGNRACPKGNSEKKTC